MCLLCLLSFQSFGQADDSTTYVSEPYLSLKLVPGGTLPLLGSRELLSTGGSVELVGDFRLLPFWYANAGLGYSIVPTRAKTGELVSLFSAGLGTTLNFEVARSLSLGAYVRGGGYYGFLSGGEPAGSGNPLIQAGAYAAYRLLPHVSLGVDASYRAFFGFASDVVLSLGASYHFHYSSPSILQVSEPDLRVLPVLYKHYDANPISTITVRNASDRPVTDVRVSFFAQEFMIHPKSCSPPFGLAPGEERRIDIRALLTDEVLGVSQGTKVSAVISADFLFKGEAYRKELVETLEIASRNAVVWDDDRKAACFVTAKDPAVLRFAKTFSALLRGRIVPAFDDALLKAMIIHEALSAYGLAYARDPMTPYAEFSKDRTALDFLQFPNQTLAYKGGDCDDLSILYSALLESLGIETAFVTTPGHILVAFRLEGDEASALSGFCSRGDFIIREGDVWVPVETTCLRGGFLRAWRLGVQGWADAEADGAAGFHPVHEAWELYEPVGFAGAEVSVGLPGEDAVLAGFEAELVKLTKRETETATAQLRGWIAEKPEDPALANRLGVLYARYGMFEEALRVLADVGGQRGYVPALVNMGHVHFLTERYREAGECYESALEARPENPRILLALVKVEQELQNAERALSLYRRLVELDPELAERVEYVSTAGVAAEDAAGRSDAAEAAWRVLQWED